MFSIDKMDKIGTIRLCNTAPTQPIQPRSTSNSLCRTNKYRRHFTSTRTVQIGKLIIQIPCFLLPHEAEFVELAIQIGYLKAVRVLALKYGVDIKPPIQNISRYKYPDVPMQIIPNLIQFSQTYVLDTPANILPYTTTHDHWSVMTQDAQYVNICNNDTVTFSTTYPEMQQYASYWLSHLPDINDSSLFVVTQESNGPRKPQTGRLMLHDNRIVFIPIVLNTLFLLYKAYPVNTPFTILFTGTLSDIAIRIRKLLNDTNVNCHLRRSYGIVRS